MCIKRFLFFLLIFMTASFSALSYEHIWGGQLLLNLEGPEVRSSTISVTTDDKILLWYRGRFHQAFQWETEFGFAFDAMSLYGVTDFVTQEFGFLNFVYKTYPELRKLALYGYAGPWGYRLGRQYFQDPGGLILGDYADGLHNDFYLGGHTLSVGAGYTGLVFLDQSDFAVTKTDYLWPSYTAVPRLFEYISWTLPGLGPGLNISTYVAAQQELTADEDLALNTERFNTQYLGIRLRGLGGGVLSYDLSLSGQLGQYGEDVTVLAGAAQFNLTFLPVTGTLRLGLDVLASTGDDWDRGSYYLSEIAPGKETLHQYLPLTTISTQGFVEEFEIGNLAALGLFFGTSSKSKKFSWEIRSTTLLRTTIGPVSSTLVIDNGSNGHFLGQEGLLSFLFQFTSDWGLSLRLGVLYPGEPLVLSQEVADYFPVLYKGGLDISLSF